MIEIEQKFPLDQKSRERLVNGAEFLGKKILADTYYDNADYILGKKDWWLRERNGRFELKVLVQGGSDATERYEEIEDDKDIAIALGLHADEPLKNALLSSGFSPFGTITTTREKYRKDGFSLDFDSTDTGFAAIEIELMVETADEADAAAQKISDFAARHGVQAKRINGKVIEFLRKNRPEHFKALGTAGIVY